MTSVPRHLPLGYLSKAQPILSAATKHRLRAGALVALLGAACTAASQNPISEPLGPKDGAGLAPTQLERVQTGSPAPDFTLRASDGTLVSLSDFRDQRSAVLVFYRGHW